MAAGDIVLGANQYGKAECRLVRVRRDTPVHELQDLNVTTQLRGDFAACHTDGDNSQVVATDTQKNTVYAFARRHPIASPEEFLTTVGRHFVEEFDWVTGGDFSTEVFAWERIVADGAPHDHSFLRSGRETRTAVVTLDGERSTVVAGLKDCTILKSTGSEFGGFPRDGYTTLPETTDRILATSLTATWRYVETGPHDGPDYDGPDYDGLYAGIRDTLLSTFASVHSLALQQTIFEMGKEVLERFGEVAEISLSCPNKHHFLVDLEPFGLDNPGEVFFAADRPYGLIQATVLREGA
ncbi:factor-independent urate hydroxylase [Nocardioides sp. cx-173]|uniref:factor-independent urate hydroxylase n=1 Tax=Nocardioides sp. cx-173 TaxID=2898796 RepID=UPI001E51FA4B|nr:urate oxidase [Nocardioides sp. cx-173]MCD4525597.1 urate oxidase [Nocardioides sp. cx-173]UGB42741.1 urate oxidase [Nocardioides sp. cx-173]